MSACTLALGASAFISLTLPFSAEAGNYGSGGGSLENQVRREEVRRQEDLIVAQKLILEGDEAMKKKDYDTAYVRYLQAADLIGSGPAVEEQRAVVIPKLSAAGVAYAEELIANGEYATAEQVAKTVLLPRYNPTYRPAVELLSHLEQPDYYNKTITPALALKRKQVMQLLTDAGGFASRGSYDLAVKRYEQVLNIDPYNTAARKGIEEVENLRTGYYNSAFNETRARLLWQVTESWEQQPRRFDADRSTILEGLESVTGTERINAKLNTIIIPRIDLRDATVREAIDFLRQRSRDLDTTEPDAQKRGVNIVYNPDLGAGAAGGLTPAVETPGAPPAAPAEGAAAIATPSMIDRINLSLSNVPLLEAIRYLTQLANLKYKVEPFAVRIVPLSVSTADLIQKEYKVPPGFIPEAAAPTAPQPAFGGPNPTTTRLAGRATAREFLESRGVTFPPGATAQYIAASSKLVVRNTQENVDLIDFLVDASVGQVPTQVEIESKFVEVSQNNLKELGFDWLLGPFSIGGNNAVFGEGGTLRAGESVSTAGFPFVEPGATVPIGRSPLTGGLRSGSSAITPTSIEGIITEQSRQLAGAALLPAPGIFAISGVFTNPQFQVVIRALNQKKGVDLMSAPRVLTKSGQAATIQLVRKFPYPTEFDPPQIPQSTGGGSGGGSTVIVIAPGTVSTQGTITPVTPSAFEVRDTGVTLKATPVVGSDGFTIDLDLEPEVVDFDGFINYGTPILSLRSTPLFQVQAVEISSNTINQPIFSTRRVRTTVSIYDGETVSLGGLVREDVQKVEDKVPFLGDIPLAGRLFRSDADQKVKRNLIIFVTARLIDAEGRALRSEEEQEEIVEPLGLPPELPGPAFPVMKGGSYGK